MNVFLYNLVAFYSPNMVDTFLELANSQHVVISSRLSQKCLLQLVCLNQYPSRVHTGD